MAATVGAPTVITPRAAGWLRPRASRARPARVVGAMTLVLGCLGLLATPAGAAPGQPALGTLPHPPTSTWTFEHIGQPKTPNGTLGAVACPSASNSSHAWATLAGAWDGTAWTIQPTPKTAGGSLEAVSCQSTTACVAVGDHLGSSGTPITLAEAWDGTAWTIQSTPNPPDDPAGTFVQLPGVSCLTTACTAVGSYYSNARNRDSSFALGKRGSSRQRPAEDRRQGLAEVSPEPRGALRRPIVTLQPSGAV